MIRFAVCDDDAFMRDDICNRIEQYMNKRKLPHLVVCFADGGELLACGEDFDVCFLDIQMKRPDGMETAAELRRRGFGGLLIFITVLKEMVFDSFEVQAFDYLLKPPDEERFSRTMERAIGRLKSSREGRIIIRQNSACRIISFSQILYCEVLGRKIHIHGREGELADYYERMERLEKQVDGRFFKCHRSYLVNLDHVQGCGSGRVSLSGGGEIPVSRLREQELKKALAVHMRERRYADGRI